MLKYIKMRHINDFTIKEYDEYKECFDRSEPDIMTIFKLFGYDLTKLRFDDFQKKWNNIQTMRISTSPGAKKIYKVGNRRFKACLNQLKLTAGQFIDYQTYVTNNNLKGILSVILLPQERKFFGWKTKKYNDGYDIIELQEYLYSNMTMYDVNELSAFFLTWSTKLLKTMKDYSIKRLVRKRKQQQANKKHSVG